jgi:DNA-binding SARP family transcriptional activator
MERIARATANTEVRGATRSLLSIVVDPSPRSSALAYPGLRTALSPGVAPSPGSATVLERSRCATVAAHFLGAFRVSIDGTAVDTGSSRRTRNLIAYLLAHRRAYVPRDVLMEVFWPGADPDSARNNLHVGLSGARRVLRAVCSQPVVERHFEAYRIASSVAVWTDVEQFEKDCAAAHAAVRAGDAAAAARHCEAACQLYQGDFLADEPYLEWAAERREGLRLRALEMQSRLVQVYAARGDHGPASVLGRRILATDPCNELVHRRLMSCYAASGQRHLALLHYHQMADTLWEILRVRPSAETTALYERLRQPRP